MQDKTFHKSWLKNIEKRNNKHLNKINIFKYILKLILILLIIITIFIIYKWGQKMPDIELLSINKEINLYQPDTLISPKLLIKNNHNQPITIQALEAKKDIINSNVIILTKPNGHYQLSNKKNIYFYSTKGILNSKKSLLKLMESVEIKSSDELHLTTSNIVYNIKKNIINGEDIVKLDGKWGILKGIGFNYNVEKAIINIKGRPKLSLYNNKGKIK